MPSEQTHNDFSASILDEGQTDQYGNPIQTIILPNYRYRCVTLPSQHEEQTRMRIFLRSGVFINVIHTCVVNDTDSVTLEIGDFYVEWDYEGFTESEAPDGQVADQLCEIPFDEHAFVTALSIVLNHIHDLPDMWQTKQR